MVSGTKCLLNDSPSCCQKFVTFAQVWIPLVSIVQSPFLFFPLKTQKDDSVLPPNSNSIIRFKDLASEKNKLVCTIVTPHPWAFFTYFQLPMVNHNPKILSGKSRRKELINFKLHTRMKYHYPTLHHETPSDLLLTYPVPYIGASQLTDQLSWYQTPQVQVTLIT